MSDESEIKRLRQAAWMLPNGPTKVSLLERAVNLADSLNDVDLGFELRQELIAANYGGRGDVLVVNFTWCLAQYDREPDRFPAHSLHWTYKWVVAAAPHFPEISRAQIEKLLDDLGDRYQKLGDSAFAKWQLRRSVMVEMADEEQARAAHARLRRTRRGYLSDCSACVASNASEYYFFIGKRAQAFRTLKPLLENRLICASQPIEAVSRALPHLYRANRIEEAQDLQKKYAKEFRRYANVTEWVAYHIEFLTLAGDLAPAVRLLDRYLAAALEDVNLWRRFQFLRAARLLMLRLVESGKRDVKLRLPESITLGDEHESKPAALAHWFLQQASQLAARFDARNGNSGFTQRLNETTW